MIRKENARLLFEYQEALTLLAYLQNRFVSPSARAITLEILSIAVLLTRLVLVGVHHLVGISQMRGRSVSVIVSVRQLSVL